MTDLERAKSVVHELVVRYGWIARHEAHHYLLTLMLVEAFESVRDDEREIVYFDNYCAEEERE